MLIYVKKITLEKQNFGESRKHLLKVFSIRLRKLSFYVFMSTLEQIYAFPSQKNYSEQDCFMIVKKQDIVA